MIQQQRQWTGEASCDTSLPNRALCKINGTVPKGSWEHSGNPSKVLFWLWNHGPLLQPMPDLTERETGNCDHSESYSYYTTNKKFGRGHRYVCMWSSCRCMSVWVCVCVCWSSLQMSSLVSLYFLILRHNVLFEEPAYHLASLASQLALGISCLCSWKLGLHADHQTHLPFTWVLGDQNSGLSAYMPHTLPTEPSPHPDQKKNFNEYSHKGRQLWQLVSMTCKKLIF